MKNLIDCNLETIGALVLMCREENRNLKDLMVKLYPETLEEKNIDVWYNGWNNKTIVYTKKDYEEMVRQNIDTIVIPSLGIEECRVELLRRIKKALGEIKTEAE